MSYDLLLQLGREALVLMLLASLPPLLASLVVGFLAGMVQATTQIQETALAVVPKLTAAVLSLLISGPWLSRELAAFTSRVLEALAGVGS